MSDRIRIPDGWAPPMLKQAYAHAQSNQKLTGMAGMDMQLTITDVADIPDVSYGIDTYPREVKHMCKRKTPILVRCGFATPNQTDIHLAGVPRQTGFPEPQDPVTEISTAATEEFKATHRREYRETTAGPPS